MDLKTIKNILHLISENEVNEVEIEEGNFRIKVKKQADVIYKGESSPIYIGENPATNNIVSSPPSASPAPSSSSTGTDSEPSNLTSPSEPEQQTPESQQITIRSPIVGTFYLAPSPESEPFVNIGDTVTKGEILCIIEAMKIMNEIESEQSGKVVKILANNSQPVEFDQPLFLIEPS